MGKRVPILLYIFVTLIFSAPTIGNPSLTASSTIPFTFAESHQTNWDYKNSFQPEMPNVTNYLNNELTDYTPQGSTVYTGNDVVPGYAATWHYVSVTMTNLHVYNDRDGLGQGAGEIFIEGGINDNFARYPDVGEYPLNDGEDQVLSELLFEGWAVTIGFEIEVREADTGFPDESLGFIIGYFDVFTTETIIITTDNLDAEITFDFVVSEVDSVFLADELLNLYKPELWIDDETTQTEMPDYVFGRVIDGNDNGVNAFVLQYYYYWTAEYSPDGIGGFKTHDHDFEAFMIYLDKSNPIIPYRFVFNNWFYTDITEAPSTTIAVFEDIPVTGEFLFDVDISPKLQGLLGSNVSLEAEYHTLDEIVNWQYATLLYDDATTYSPNGVVTVETTIETSYHTFDLGPTVGNSGYYGYAYSISELNDTLITELYSIVEDTFAEGVHAWTYFGIDIPKVAPFTFDVTQVFTAPYVITGYENVIDNAAAITRASNSRLDIDIDGYVGVGFNVPTELTVSYPNQLSVGTNTIDFSFSPEIEQTEITLSYGASVNISYTFWFLSGEIIYNHEGEFSINPFSNEMQSLAGLLGVGDYEAEDIEINDYLSAGLTLHPTLFGTIIEGEINLNILEVIDAIFGTNPNVKLILFLLDFIIEDFTLTATANLDAVIRHEIQVPTGGVTLSASEVTYSDSSTQSVGVTIDETYDLNQGLTVTIPNGNYDLDFYVDWSIELGFKSPISTVIPDLSIPIGTLPDWTANILQTPGGSFIIPAPTSSVDSDVTPAPILGFAMTIVCLSIIPKLYRLQIRQSKILL